LREVLADPKWGKVASEVSPEKVVIERKLSAFFYNSWNPIFEGKFAFDGQRPCLVGHFRVHWLVLMLTLAALAYPLFEVVTLLYEPNVKPGYVAGWKEAQIIWNLEFFGFGLLTVCVGWLFGLPNAKRIVDAINESKAGT